MTKLDWEQAKRQTATHAPIPPSKRPATQKQRDYIKTLRPDFPDDRLSKISLLKASDIIDNLKSKPRRLERDVQGITKCLMCGTTRAKVARMYPEMTPLQLSQFTEEEGRLLIEARKAGR
jgi:hypothetical protein